MGRDTMAALVEDRWRGKALVGVCYTSNRDGRQTQDPLMADGRPSWEHYAEWILQWAQELGVVETPDSLWPRLITPLAVVTTQCLGI
jgi:hypothetical protein